MKIKNKERTIVPFEALQSGDCFLDMVLEVPVMKVDGGEITNAVILKTGELMSYDKNESVIALPEAEMSY